MLNKIFLSKSFLSKMLSAMIFSVFFIFISCLGTTSASAGSYDLFFRAVNADNHREVAKLLERGLDPNIIEEVRGDTGLILAMRSDSMRVVEVLLKASNIDLEAQARNGDNALMIAAFKANIPAVRGLLARGAQVNRAGWTALHYAAASGENTILQLLLERRALVDSPSPNGTTALMMAARGGHSSSVQLLLDAGANPSLINDQGYTPIEMAKLFNNTSIINTLTQRIKKIEQTPKTISD
jgi:hypothetical protein